MSTSLFGLIEMLGVFGLVLGVVGWQIWDWQRWRRQRDAEREAERDAERKPATHTPTLPSDPPVRSRSSGAMAGAAPDDQLP